MPIRIRALPTQAEERRWLEIVALAEAKKAGRGAKVRDTLPDFLEQACRTMDATTADATFNKEGAGAFNPFMPASRIWREVLGLALDMAVNGDEEAKRSITCGLGDLDDSFLPLHRIVFSQHYAEYWVKRTGIVAPKLGDQGNHDKRFAAYEEVAQASALPPYSVGTRPLQASDWTPRWEDSATTTMVEACVTALRTGGIEVRGDTLRYGFPQCWWDAALGPTWTDVGANLQAASARLGPSVYNRLGQKVPMFHLTLVVDRKLGAEWKSKEGQWMGELLLTWDTTVVDGEDRYFRFVLVPHVMRRLLGYLRLVPKAQKAHRSLPTMPAFLHWAAGYYGEGVLPQDWALDDIPKAPGEAAPADSQMATFSGELAGLAVDQTRATELVYMLEDRLEHLAIRTLERELASEVLAPAQWLANYVCNGKSATLPIGGEALQPSRRRWAKRSSLATLKDDVETRLHNEFDMGGEDLNDFVDYVVKRVTQPSETWELLLDYQERKELVFQCIRKWPGMFPDLPKGVASRIIQGIMANA